MSRDNETKHPSAPKYQVKNTQEVPNVLCRLFSAFRLGEKLQDLTFKNAVVDEFFLVCAMTRKVPPKKVITRLCEHESLETTPASAFVDLVATRDDVMTIINDDSHWPTEFIVKVAQACMRDRALSLDQRCRLIAAGASIMSTVRARAGRNFARVGCGSGAVRPAIVA